MDTKLTDSAFPIIINDKTYQASMLTDRDYGDIQEWAQAQFIRKATIAAKVLDAEARREVITIALQESAKITFGEELCTDLVWTTEGRIFTCWVMLRKRHPKLVYEIFKNEYLKNQEDSDEQMVTAYRKLNIVESEASGGASTGNTKSE